MKRWMNVYMKAWEEGRKKRARKEEATEEGEEVERDSLEVVRNLPKGEKKKKAAHPLT